MKRAITDDLIRKQDDHVLLKPFLDEGDTINRTFKFTVPEKRWLKFNEMITEVCMKNGVYIYEVK